MHAAIEPLTLDGSHGEGGGALLRTALVMSSITGRPVTVLNARGALRHPGLNAEDLMVVDALAAAVDADVSGEVGEDRVEFRPRRHPRALRQSFDAQAYGPGQSVATAVVAQAVLPVLARGGAYSVLELQGATHGANTLAFEAFEHGSLSAHRQQGVYAAATLRRAAFFPAGHGSIQLEVEPSVPLPVEWHNRGRLESCGAAVVVVGYGKEHGERAADRVHSLFGEAGLSPEVTLVRHESDAPDVQVTCWAKFSNGIGVGAATGRGKAKIEHAAEAAFREFLEWYSGDATADAFTADQLLVTACLAEGKSVYSTPRVTKRLTTMAWVVRQFLPIRVTVHGVEGGPGRVVVER